MNRRVNDGRDLTSSSPESGVRRLGGDLRVTHESISDVSTRLAKRRAGSVETNRHTSKQFEQKRPDLDILRQTNGKLNEQDTMRDLSTVSPWSARRNAGTAPSPHED